jgi:O-acetyl-ADP-ribose deacetylase (regulator of RNase III)
MEIEIVKGDILQQDVEVIVNSWNRNIIPWWLLIPQGVSGAIKRKAGVTPFVEIGKFGAIPLGEARVTSSGKLPYKAIIHVAGINMFWCGTERSVRNSVINAMSIVNEKKYSSVAFPLIGSGSGNRGEEWSQRIMESAFSSLSSEARVLLVKYAKNS